MQIEVDAILRSKGIFVSSDWIVQCIEYMKSNAHIPHLKFNNLASMNSTQVADIVLGYALCSNFHEVCANDHPLTKLKYALQSSLASTATIGSSLVRLSVARGDCEKYRSLETPSSFFIDDMMVLQCDEIVNVGCTHDKLQKTQESNSYLSNRDRLLQLFLTDGRQHIVGIETAPIDGLHPQSAPGMKLMVKGVRCHRGALLISPGNCKILGGEVLSLQNLVQASLSPKDEARAIPSSVDSLSPRATVLLPTMPSLRNEEKRAEDIPVIISGVSNPTNAVCSMPVEETAIFATNPVEKSISDNVGISEESLNEVGADAILVAEGCENQDFDYGVDKVPIALSRLVALQNECSSRTKSAPIISRIVNIIPSGIRRFKVADDEFLVHIMAVDEDNPSLSFVSVLSDVVCREFLGISPSQYSTERMNAPKSERAAIAHKYAASFEHFQGLYWAQVHASDGTVSQNSETEPIIFVTKKAAT